MAVRIEIHRDMLKTALEHYASSLKRGSNTAKSPSFKELYDKDLTTLNVAIASITEIK